ncbi:MAG: hypothetical protein JNM70_10765 [Anaerolineae bacterium]|nr:hypothetical protein [Anaerolineae bacterium]
MQLQHLQLLQHFGTVAALHVRSLAQNCSSAFAEIAAISATKRLRWQDREMSDPCLLSLQWTWFFGSQITLVSGGASATFRRFAFAVFAAFCTLGRDR